MAGWVENRGKNKWRLNAPGGTGPDGKRKTFRKVVEAKSEREAKKLLANFVAEVQSGQYIEPSKLTFKEFTDRWLRDYAETNLEPKTIEGYKEKLTRILEAMGHLKIEKIKPFHLIEFYKNLQEDGIRKDGKPGGLSHNNIRHHHRVISTILQDAVEWQVIPSNPASRVKPPKVPKKKAACYDEEQTAAMLAALENEPLKYQVAVVLTIATGLREGELMGLEWQDIDFENNTIQIRQSSQYLPGKGTFIKNTKNETSERVISIPESAMALIKQYKVHQAQERLKVGDLWQGTERIFTTWDGRPMYTYTVGAWFRKFLARTIIHKPCNKPIEDKTYCPHCEKTIKAKEVTNLAPLPFHGLRHTSATLLIDQGLHAKVISERLGHANIGTTMDIYGHFLKNADKKAADKLDHLFNGDEKKENTE